MFKTPCAGCGRDVPRKRITRGRARCFDCKKKSRQVTGKEQQKRRRKLKKELPSV